MDTMHSEYKRILGEMAALIAPPERVELPTEHAYVQIGKYIAWFIYDDMLDWGSMFVYVDIGPPASVPNAYRDLLRFNLKLFGSSVFGTVGLHPDTDHIVYVYRYRLGTSSSGQDLLDSLLKVVNGLSSLELPISGPS